MSQEKDAVLSNLHTQSFIAKFNIPVATVAAWYDQSPEKFDALLSFHTQYFIAKCNIPVATVEAWYNQSPKKFDALSSFDTSELIIYRRLRDEHIVERIEAWYDENPKRFTALSKTHGALIQLGKVSVEQAFDLYDESPKKFTALSIAHKLINFYDVTLAQAAAWYDKSPAKLAALSRGGALELYRNCNVTVAQTAAWYDKSPEKLAALSRLNISILIRDSEHYANSTKISAEQLEKLYDLDPEAFNNFVRYPCDKNLGKEIEEYLNKPRAVQGEESKSFVEMIRNPLSAPAGQKGR